MAFVKVHHEYLHGKEDTVDAVLATHGNRVSKYQQDGTISSVIKVSGHGECIAMHLKEG